MELDNILKSIAIEEASPDLVYRWKMNLMARKVARRKTSLWPYIAFPLLFSGVCYYIVAFKENILEYFMTDRFAWVMERISYSLSQFVDSGNFHTWSIVLSLTLAVISLIWYFATDIRKGTSPIRF